MKKITEYDISFIDNSNVFVLNTNTFDNVNIKYYDLVDSSGIYSKYYLAIRFIDYNNIYEYQWCREFPEINNRFDVSFEEVIDNVNSEIKESLLFHLDIFS